MRVDCVPHAATGCELSDCLCGKLMWAPQSARVHSASQSSRGQRFRRNAERSETPQTYDGNAQTGTTNKKPGHRTSLAIKQPQSSCKLLLKDQHCSKEPKSKLTSWSKSLPVKLIPVKVAFRVRSSPPLGCLADGIKSSPHPYNLLL
jgi:hypothetical protein